MTHELHAKSKGKLENLKNLYLNKQQNFLEKRSHLYFLLTLMILKIIVIEPTILAKEKILICHR